MATITNLKFAIDSSWNGAGVTAARGDLKLLQQDLRRVQNTKIRVEVDVNDTSARAALRKLDNDTRNRAMEIRVDADTKFAEAQIDAAARDRHANIFVNTHGAVDEIDRLDSSMKRASSQSVELGTNASLGMRWARLGAMAFAASLVVLPGLIQTIGGALTVGLGGAFIAMGALFHKENQAIKDGAKALGDTFMASGRRASEGMIKPIVAGLADLRHHVIGLEPQFRKAFDGASQAIAPLVDGLAWMVENSMPGVIKAMQNITPVANGLRDGMANFGSQMSRMFAGMAEGADGLGRALNTTFTQIGVLMANFGVAAGQMAEGGAALWDGFLKGFNNFVAGYLDGMVKMVQQNGPAFGQFWIDFGNAVGGFLREALPGIGRLGAAISEHLGPVIVNLLPPLGRLIGAMADALVPAIEKAGPIIQQIAEGLGWLMDWMARTGPVATGLAAAFVILNVAMRANPVILIISSVIMLIGWLVSLEQRTQVFSNAWKSVTDSISGGTGVVGEWVQKLKDLFGPSFSEIFRKVKEAVSEAWDSIKTSFSGLMDQLRPLWNELKPVLAVIGGLLLGIGKIALDMIANGIKPAFRMFGEIISEIIQVIKGVVQVITGVIRFVKGVVEVIVGLVRAIAAFFTGNNEAFTNAMKVFRQGFTDIFAGIGKAFQGLWTIVTAVWDSITSIFRNGAQIVWGLVSGFVEGVVNFFKWLWDVLVGHSIVPDMINAIWDWFMWLPRKIIGIVSDFVGGVVNFFQWLWDRVTEKWNAFWTWYSGMWSGAWNWAKDFVGGVWDWIVGKWNGFWDWVGNKWNAFWGWFSGIFTNAWTQWRDFLSGVWDWISNKWNGFWDWIGQRWTSFRDWLSGLWTGFWNWVKDFVGGVWDGIVQKFDEIKTKIGEIVQGMVDKVRDIWNTITGIFEGPINGVKGIWNGVAGVFGLPKFAEGGAVQAYATGGAVFGPGTSTSDSIPALLSNDEHVWTAREVNAAGGHKAVESMRAEVLSGKRGRLPEYAAGGPVEWMWARVKELQPSMSLTSSYRDTADNHGAGRAIDVSNGTDSTPQMRDLTRQIHDAWGKDTLELIHSPSPFNIKNGRNVGDGFGFYGAGTMGQHRNHVHWAVERALDGRSGAAVPGGGGSSYAPLSGEDLRKYNEAISGFNRIIDQAALSSATLKPSDMNRAAEEAKTPGWQGPVLATNLTKGGREYLASQVMSQVQGPGGVWNPAGDTAQIGTIRAALKAITDLEAGKAARESMGVGGPIGGVIPEGERRAIIEAAMRATNTPPPSTADAWLAGMNTLITRESGWNAGAVNNWDSNAAAGNSSRGLAQVIPTTFNAHKAPGLNNIDAPVDNVAASINYIKSRYGTIENVQQANANMPPKGYAMGTSNAAAGWHLVGEAGPEMVEFKGGETVKTFDEIIAALKTAATTEGRQTAEKVSQELKALIDKIGQMNFGNNEVNIQIQIDGAQDAIAIVESVKAQLIPQLEMLLRQKVGIRA